MSIVVDVHTHMVTQEYLALLRDKGAPKYTFRRLPSGGEVIDKHGTPFFTLLPDMWDFPARIRAMDEARVDVAVVSLTSPNAYLGDEETSVRAARLMNDAFADAQRTWPDRIRWFASLPWQHADAAIAELGRARALGAVGVMVIANIEEMSLTADQFAPVWKAIDEAGMPVFIHPSVPPGGEMMDMTQYNMSPSVGFTFDTSLAVSRMMYDGFFDRYRNIRIIAAHGGGALPFLIGRLDFCYERIPASASGAKFKPSAYLDRVFLDAVVFTQGALQLCVDTVGPQNMLYGSDYPHNIGDMKGCLARVDALDADTARRTRGENAVKLFGL
jgi:aminocarboxymuconate-semialdehyde decarboxylase